MNNKGHVFTEDENTLVPVKPVYSVNTYSWIQLPHHKGVSVVSGRACEQSKPAKGVVQNKTLQSEWAEWAGWANKRSKRPSAPLKKHDFGDQKRIQSFIKYFLIHNGHVINLLFPSFMFSISLLTKYLRLQF